MQLLNDVVVKPVMTYMHAIVTEDKLQRAYHAAESDLWLRLYIEIK